LGHVSTTRPHVGAVSINGRPLVSYPRRQQLRRVSRSLRAGAAGIAAALLATALASAGAMTLGALLMVVAVGLGLRGRHWLRLAARSGIGAESEDEVRQRLTVLRWEGWRLRHSLLWQGAGDIDSVALTPSGMAFAIETKTRTYDDRHLIVVREQAAWLSKRRQRWCPQGAVPILCVVRERGVHRWERGVLVVSIDLLIPALRLAAGAGVRRAA